MTNPNVHPTLAAALDERGYDTLTTVQSAVVEEEAHGRDLVVSAKTGSGKTVAFGLAMAGQLIEGERVPWSHLPLGLVIAPTRELALQVGKELQWLYAKAGARIVTCVGGMDPMKERRALQGGAHIVVGTPGRLRDHLERGALDLSELRVVVLDEADEMLDMGFREELEEILDATPEGRRTLLFSATMPRPIQALAKRYQKDSLRIETIAQGESHADIAYQCVSVNPTDIEHAVVNLLRFHEAETAILFCATRDAVRRLHALLNERGFQVVALSGEHSQSERNNALQALRDGRARVCVATDVAARGIDLPSVGLVIHVELPRDPEALQHRSGRTGRAGRKGTAVLLVPFRRRRNVEALLRQAKITPEWIDPPLPEEIRSRDRARLLEQLTQPVEMDDDDRAFADQLMATLTPAEIAAALVRTLKTDLPAPEDILVSGGRDAPQRDAGPRPGFEGSTWFRINAGRRHRAEARWLLPLICRYGHLTRQDIGAIRIAASESYFEVAARSVPAFRKALSKAVIAPEDEGLMIDQTDGPPPADQGGDRPRGPRPHPMKNRPPIRKGPRKGPPRR
ncbi:DEAD/DEAH box helicase [Sphingomonas jaspsi]|uniref:DEAD/DEAH box helicase n=1 Tax=Sphingomonas jaspsi TaxID=392409 RepID=UPI000565618F|nr:DEAD/DEAH box helicase [Sphingomonas jaspsi]